MSYLDEWTTLKDKFKAGNDEIIARIKAAKAQLKKLRKEDTPDAEAIEELEDLIAAAVTVSKKPTGMSQALPAYEKILDKMDEMVARGVPPTDKAKWLPLVKGLKAARKEMEKANANTQKVFGKVVTDTARGYSAVTKSKDDSSKELRKFLTGKNPPAKELLWGLEKLQQKIQDRMTKVWKYIGPSIGDWG